MSEPAVLAACADLILVWREEAATLRLATTRTLERADALAECAMELERQLTAADELYTPLPGDLPRA